MMVSQLKKIIILLFTFLVSLTVAKAQCGALISTYPYSENFEAAPAWTSGGVNSDWAWGAPTHPIISSAGGGTKCWTAGGLSGSFYNYSEQAWITSPCFDFTTLNYPWISFKIFWEDEWKYDGLVLQSSIDGGTTWVNVGAFGDPVNCLNDNWYTYGNITWLNSLPAGTRNGWTGRTGPTVGSCQGGNGSLTWVTAKHCMSSLANQPSVKFRFLFGSGTTCNSYDGISIDDIFIDNAPPNVANFTSACAGANTINFTNTSTMCPTGSFWDFGDGATSTTTSPSHTYAAAGTYNVTLVSSGPCNASGTITLPVTILSVSSTVTNVSCNGANDGTATATVVGGAGPFTYSWTPGGASTATATGLAPGTYTVNVSAAGSCPATTTAIITQPAPLTASTVVTPVSCFGGNNGTATTTAVGGTTPYTYSWTPSGGTTTAASTLSVGTYTVTITDAHSCITTATATIIQPVAPLSVTTVNTPVSCFGGINGTATATALGGTAPYTYAWSPTGGSSAHATGLSSGVYTITVTDAHSCTTSAITTINQPSSAVSTSAVSTSASCSANDGTATAISIGGTAPYIYSWSPAGGTSTTATTLAPGTYTVNVTDANGCTTSTTVTVAGSPGVVSSLVTTPIICYNGTNGTASVTATGGTGPYSYSWSGGQTGTTITGLTAGNYCVITTDASGCADTACTNLTNPAPMVGDFTSDPSVTDIYNPVIHFTDQSPGAVTWNWSFGDTTGTTSENPSHTYPLEGTYPVTLIVTNSQGCVDTVTHDIIVNDGFTFYAPNAFTPDGDGLNDTFLPKGSNWDPTNFDMWIFDRWGNIVFHTSDMNKGWNGNTKNNNAALMDVYVWKVHVSALTGQKHEYLGSVTTVQ